jgi:hypothetical protein
MKLRTVKEAAFRVGLLTDIAMISTTMKPASLMKDLAVDLMSIQIGAQNACVFKKEEKEVV